jgi:acyl-CoA synthetase (AMP-forming)/AMP-acid ligase II
MQWLAHRFATAPEASAFVHRGRRMTYGEVVARIDEYRGQLRARAVGPGDIVAVLGDYSPETFCFLLALAFERTVIIPLSRESVIEQDVALAISGCDWIATFDEAGADVSLAPHEIVADGPLLTEFIARGRPGLILFSSGSTGAPKAILHDLALVAEKFRKQRDPVTSIAFLMIDHFGGINTLFAITSSLGTVVTVSDRSVSTICKAIEDNRVELLPATPSFLTMLVASGLHRDHDLSSLRRITYGTEVMPQSTLERLGKAFPDVALQQTYGLSEVGVLRSQSRPDGSLWVRLGGEGFETKVVDGILFVRSQYAMVGYLNAPSKFDAEGWFNTQDRVEVDGDYLRILGRTTDLINVGGQKVYPAEVEDVILTLDNVADVAVSGEEHPLMGQMVVARVLTRAPEAATELKKRVRSWCRTRLAGYKIPTKVILADGPMYTGRQKKIR